MKKLFFKTILFLFALTLFNCEDNTNTNDSTGNDSFSCYINGKLYTPSAGTGIGGGDIRPFYWTYEFDDKVFSIYTGGEYAIRITTINTVIGSNILNEKLGDTFDFSHSGMIVQNELIYYNTKDNQNNGTVTFTEYNETKAVGTFQCTLYNENGDELKVTNGKFNLSLDSRTN